MNYDQLVGDARLAIYDGIVKGKPFADTVRDVLDIAARFGDRQAAEGLTIDLNTLTPGVAEALTENASDDWRMINALVATEALGKMFSGDMHGVVALIVDSGIRFGFAVRRKVLADPVVETMFQAVVDNAKLANNPRIPDAPATALLEAIMKLKAEAAIYYFRRFLEEEKLTTNPGLPAFHSAVKEFSRIIIDL